MKVAVIGCGPAGLLAAHAASQRGAEVRIYAPGKPSPIGGAQYLHSSIPGLTDPDKPTMLTYLKVGEPDGYAKKAYGESSAQISWDTFVTGEYPAWHLRDVYNRLYDRWLKSIDQLTVGPIQIRELCKVYDLVFSSAPLDKLCCGMGHKFNGQSVVYTKERKIDIENVIVYNGRETDPWYRTAKLFGEYSTEYAVIPQTKGIPWGATTWLTGVKPTDSDCNCYSEFPNFIKIGRFGRWRRGVLTDHTYAQVYERVTG